MGCAADRIEQSHAVALIYAVGIVAQRLEGLVVEQLTERLAQLLIVLLQHMMVLLLVGTNDPLVEEQGLLAHHNKVAEKEDIKRYKQSNFNGIK